MGILNVYLYNINLDHVNFDEDDPEAMIHVRLMAWPNGYKQHKTFKNKLSEKQCL